MVISTTMGLVVGRLAFLVICATMIKILKEDPE